MRKTAKYWLKKLYRHSFSFKRYYRQIEQISQLDPIELHRYQNAQLQQVVSYCAHKVPFYKSLFKEAGIKPEHIKTTSDLKHLPILDKQVVREQFNRLTAESWEQLFYRKASTSGSSGSPSNFLRDFQSINFENAAIWHYWNQSGDCHARRITLRGERICPVEQTEPPFWQYNPANNELIMSIYHLSPQSFPAYLEKIREFQPEVLYCYPSAGYLLAKLFQDSNENYAVKYIFTSSESLEEPVRTFVEATFHCEIHDWYGQAERVAAIAQCRKGNYHIQEHYSWVELTENNDGYEIIGTTFHNRAMPLLRYRTHDTVLPLETPCPCRSPYRAIRKIIGRPAAYLSAPDGRRIPNVQSLIMRDVDHILESQIYQDHISGFEIRLVTNGQFSEQDRQRLLQQAKRHTAPGMQIDIVEVPEIPRGPNGKFQSLINLAEASDTPKQALLCGTGAS